MADCVCLKGCIFFNDKMGSVSPVASLYKMQYCRGTNTGCARWMVFSTLGKEAVPQDLYPNRVDLAREILSRAAGNPQ